MNYIILLEVFKNKKVTRLQVTKHTNMTEDQLQQSIIIEFRNKYQIKGLGLIFSVPNGGSRNILEAKKLKMTGSLAGVSDLIVLLPKKTLFIELKIEKGIQSEVQHVFEKNVSNLGFKYYLVRSLEQFIKIIENEQQRKD